MGKNPPPWVILKPLEIFGECEQPVPYPLSLINCFLKKRAVLPGEGCVCVRPRHLWLLFHSTAFSIRRGKTFPHNPRKWYLHIKKYSSFLCCLPADLFHFIPHWSASLFRTHCTQLWGEKEGGEGPERTSLVFLANGEMLKWKPELWMGRGPGTQEPSGFWLVGSFVLVPSSPEGGIHKSFPRRWAQVYRVSVIITFELMSNQGAGTLAYCIRGWRKYLHIDYGMTHQKPNHSRRLNASLPRNSYPRRPSGRDVLFEMRSS